MIRDHFEKYDNIEEMIHLKLVIKRGLYATSI